MNELQTFNFENNQIRTQMVNDEPYFCLADVCGVLGLKNSSDRTFRDGVETFYLTDNLGRQQQATFINEKNLYRLIFRSNKEQAQIFADWVYEEVLPAIRKHGGYLTEQKIEEALLNPDTLIELATNLKEEREKRKALEAEKQENKPYVSFAKSVEASVNSVLIGMFAKTLSEENGVKIGQNRLFEWLRKNGYLMDVPGERYNTPYQKYIDNGYFEVATLTFAGTTGTHQKFTTKITGKGQISLAQKIVDAFRIPVLAA